MVRNRDRWTVTRHRPTTATLTLSKLGQRGIVDFPPDYGAGHRRTRLRRHRIRQPRRHPHRRRRPRQPRHHRPRPLRRHDPRPQRERRPRHHRHPRTRRSPRHPRAVLAVDRVESPPSSSAANSPPVPHPHLSGPAHHPGPPDLGPHHPRLHPGGAADRCHCLAPTVPAAPIRKGPRSRSRSGSARHATPSRRARPSATRRRRTNVIHQRRLEITSAEQHLEHATTACEPFDTAVTAARRTLDAATRDRDVIAERAAKAPGSVPDATPADDCPSPNTSWDRPEPARRG